MEVDESICTKCGACASACPVDAIDVMDKGIEVSDSCTDCGICEDVCPIGAITIDG